MSKKSSKKKKNKKKKQSPKLPAGQGSAQVVASARTENTHKVSPEQVGEKKKKHSATPEKNVKIDTAKFQEKIHLEKNSHTYFSALHQKYGKHFKKVEGPFKKIMRVLGIGLGLVFLFVLALYLTFGRDLPDVGKLKDMNFAETTHIYDRNGHELYRIYGSENREYVKLSEISPYMVHAIIAIEDKNFYRHFGFDPVGIIRAQLKNLKDDGISQGASTITQQLARNVFLSAEQTYERKIKEILLSLEIEWFFDKDEILELYFNKIPYGSNAFGIEAAAQTYFGVAAKDLSLAQASILASFPKAPSYFSPYGPHVKELMGYCESNVDEESESEIPNTQEQAPAPGSTQQTQELISPAAGSCSSPFDANYVWGRKDLVLQRMLDDGYITKSQFVDAWNEARGIKFKDLKHTIEDPHFVFYVKDYLTQKYGKEAVENGGLQVITTLDPVIQKAAEESVANHVDLIRRYGANNAAMVALDPKSGQILAMVGSRDYWDEKIDGQVNVTLSARQPGSSFKPLVYAAAVQNAGIGSGTYLGDYKTIFNKHDTPNNYDGKFQGHITIRQAIGGSRNIPAIKAYYVAGEEDKVLDFVEKLGITNLRQFRDEFNKDADKRGWTFFFGWPLAIGSGEVRLMDLVNAYATFANQGKYNAPNPILEIRDRNGVLLESFRNPDGGKQVIDPQVAFIMNSILSDVAARPAGSWRWLLTIPGQNVAAKTGTSNKVVRGRELPNNNITVGYTPSIAAGFWVGNTDGKNLINSAYSLYTTDPIYHEFFEKVLKDKPKEDFTKPAEIKQVGREFFPNWGGQRDFEKMFKRVTQQQAPDVPLPDFLKKRPEDVKAYKQTLDKINEQQQRGGF